MSDNSYKEGFVLDTLTAINTSGQCIKIADNIKIADKSKNTGKLRNYLIVQNQTNVNIHLCFQKPVDIGGGVYVAPSIMLQPGQVWQEFTEEVHDGEIYAYAYTAYSADIDYTDGLGLNVFYNGAKDFTTSIVSL